MSVTAGALKIDKICFYLNRRRWRCRENKLSSRSLVFSLCRIVTTENAIRMQWQEETPSAIIVPLHLPSNKRILLLYDHTSSQKTQEIQLKHNCEIKKNLK